MKDLKFNIMIFFIVVLALRFIIKLRFPPEVSISTIILRRYGSDKLQLFRSFEKLDKKVRKAQLDMNFLHSCKFYDVIPRFLNFKLSNARLRSSMMYTKCRKRLLSVELAHKRKHLQNLQEKLTSPLQDLRSCFSWFDFNHLVSFVNSHNIKSLKRTEAVQNRKLDTLRREYLATGIDPNNVIFNLSSYTLNDIEKKALSRGLKFCLRPEKLDYCNFLTPFEKLSRNLKSKPIVNQHLNFEFVKARLKSLALSAYYGYDSLQLPLNISKAEISALDNLSKNRNIVIIRPDKGNGVVLLDRSDYVNKVEALLADASEFSRLDIDILEVCQRRENRLVRFLRDTLLKQRAITDNVYRQLFPSGSVPGILYGLPKVHKDTCPARPILSAIGTFNYKLAKFFVPLLQPFTSGEYTVKDSFSLYLRSQPTKQTVTL